MALSGQDSGAVESSWSPPLSARVIKTVNWVFVWGVSVFVCVHACVRECLTVLDRNRRDLEIAEREGVGFLPFHLGSAPVNSCFTVPLCTGNKLTAGRRPAEAAPNSTSLVLNNNKLSSGHSKQCSTSGHKNLSTVTHFRHTFPQPNTRVHLLSYCGFWQSKVEWTPYKYITRNAFSKVTPN